MDREYLEDYKQKENEEYERIVGKRIREGKFDFEKERYPPDSRFVNLKKPVAMMGYLRNLTESLWSQLPFCGSMVLSLPSFPKSEFEEYFFKISDIPKIIDFIKETGKLQIMLDDPPTEYENLEYFDLIFEELNPPINFGVPIYAFWKEKEIQRVANVFHTLGRVRFFDLLRKIAREVKTSSYLLAMSQMQRIYMILKLGNYAVAEDVENLMIDDPSEALGMFSVCGNFIAGPLSDLRGSQVNFTLRDIRESKMLPLVFQPEEHRFPCEIGKFLLEKLTYATQDMRACYDLIDHYDAYDLQKVQESLNDAIVANHPGIVNKSAEEFSEILDNVWNDPAVPRQIKNLKRGLPMSIAAIGTAVSAFTGGLEGFLAGLGFSVGAKFLDAEIEGLSEKVVKFFARSYQANVYDFKKKYKDRIVKERHEKAK